MSPEDFRRAWEGKGDLLVRFPAEVMTNEHLPLAAKTFLQAAGLPSGAAPFVSFGPQQQGSWPISHEYYVIGSDSAGSPIVVVPDGRVLLLDHDFNFRPSYVNRDLPTLAKCLLQFRDVISEAAEAGEPDEIDIDQAALEAGMSKFLSMLEVTDPEALAPETFWTIEARSFVLASAS